MFSPFGLVTVLAMGLWAQPSESQFTVQNCPNFEGQMGVFGRSCFHFVTNKERDFWSAEGICAQNGGTLAMPKTQAIQDFLVNTLRNYGFYGEFWIGLDDRISENVFKWADGSILNRGDFANWEFNNGHLAILPFVHHFEDCVVLKVSNGKWHDYHCKDEPFLNIFMDFTKPYICEYKITDPLPTTAPPAVPTTTTPVPTTTTPVPTTTTPIPTTEFVEPTCPPFICDLDCGMTGYLIDPETDCQLCECDEK